MEIAALFHFLCISFINCSLFIVYSYVYPCDKCQYSCAFLQYLQNSYTLFYTHFDKWVWDLHASWVFFCTPSLPCCSCTWVCTASAQNKRSSPFPAQWAINSLGLHQNQTITILHAQFSVSLGCLVFSRVCRVVSHITLVLASISGFRFIAGTEENASRRWELKNRNIV